MELSFFFSGAFALLVLFVTMSFSVFFEMHGMFFNLMFSLFHRINIIMNDLLD